jgi:hypothetical protein
MFMIKTSETEKKKLWRYMPLISLLDFLQTGELRFPRANTFDDIQEGHVGLDAMLETIPPNLHHQAKAALERQNAECFVSCWHLSASESLAMWKVYGIHNFSVALVSNVGKVMSVCHEYCKNLSSTGMFGEVIYENYVTDGKLNVKTMGIPFGYSNLPIPTSVLTLFMKAKAFSYEQEWRLVIHKAKFDESSLRVSVGSIEDFVEAIYISPEAPDWMVSSIQTLISEQFNFPKILVSKSPLSRHFGYRKKL